MDYKEITTVEAAFAALGMDVNVVPDVSVWPEDMRQHKAVEFKLQMVVRAINGDWKADWNDTDQDKRELWLRVVKDETRASGRGLRFCAVGYVCISAYVGPRLVFQDELKAKHAWEFFKPLYEEYYLGN